MTCRAVHRRLSALIDGELPPAQTGRVLAHLGTCEACRRRLESLRGGLASLSDLPRLVAPEPIAPRVLARLEVESRGPGLALLFRSRWKARPLIVPSLLPAGGVLTIVLAIAVTLGSGAPSGTEANPLPAWSDVGLPRTDDAGLVPERLAEMSEGTLFVETVVARDGSVSALTVLDGDLPRVRPLLDALRRERFEPARFRGRPVAVSVYRLISCLEVRPPTT